MSGNPNAPSLLRLLPMILLGGLILGWPAYVNGYPLVFADTGNYIGQVKLHFIGWTAPPFYSAFLSATDLGLSLWGPRAVQRCAVAEVSPRCHRSAENSAGGVMTGFPDRQTSDS
jgi:hypothetical protein